MVAPLTKLNVSAIFRTFLAAAATLFAVALPAAGATIIGPTDPGVLPGGAPLSLLGAANAYGRAGGQTWSFGAIPYAGQTTVWHGAVRNEVKFTMSGPTFANPGEVMTFDAASSNLATGTLVFNGSTLMPADARPVFTRAVLQYQDTAGANVPVISPASVSVPTDGGVLVVPAAGFRLNFRFDASFTNGAGYIPALDFYDANTVSSGTAQVSFTAGFYSLNANPVLAANTGLSIAQGATATITSAVLRATDAESLPAQLTYTLGPGGEGGTVIHGVLRNGATPLVAGGTFTQADINAGNITYTNDPISATSCFTADAFQFNVTDANGGFTPQPPLPTSFNFNIGIGLVNLPPVVNNPNISVALGGTFNGTLTATNNDCFTPTFAFSVVTPPTKGNVTINPNGTYTYTATPGQTGGDSFTFNVSDGVLNAAAPGTVTVTIANQPPVAQDQTLTTNEGSATSGTLVAADPDVPASPLTYAIATNGTKGTAFIINSSTGAFIYTPAAGRMGTDTFTFTASDGTLSSVPATVTVNIFPQVSAGRAVVSAGAATSGPTSGKSTKLFVVNPANGDFGLLSSGGSLIEVRGVAVETSHNVLAVDAAPALIRVDAITGGQSVLAPSLGTPFAVGVDVEANGNILLALGPVGVSRRNPATGAQINAFTDPLLTAPLGVAVAPNGDIYVANAGPIAGGLPQVLRINPVSGATSVVSSGGLLTFPVGIAVGITGTIYVTDAPGIIGGPAPSTLLSIDPVSGAQAIVAQDGLLSKPTSVAVEASGTLLVASSGNGSLVRVNPVGGATTLVASPPEFNGLWGVAVVSTPPTLTGVVSRKTHGAAGPFDLALDTTAPIGGAVSVEPRSIGSGHQIVFPFSTPIAFPGVVTAVDAASNPVGTATAVASGNDVVVTLMGIPDNSRATVTLTNVNDTGLNTSVSIGFLVGDVNNSRSVTATDILQVKGRSGQATDATNFRYDLNASGSITASDILAVKGRSGLVLP